MNNKSHKWPVRLYTVCAVVLLMLLFAVGAAALSFRSGSMPDAANNPAESTVGDTTAADSFVTDATDTIDLSGDTTAPDSAPGTGEFFDDTTGSFDENPPADAPNAPVDDTTEGKVESALDNVVTDAEGAVSDVVDGAEDMLTGNGSVWGIVLMIIIIAAVAVLLFALFSRKK